MATVSLFDYNQNAPLDIREVDTEKRDGTLCCNMTYKTPFNRRRAAFFVSPDSEGPFPVILYVHWYEPKSPDSNRTQFLDEALSMAKRGAASLLIETMWSDRDWFIKRTQDEDYDNSILQIIELRRAMDLLLKSPGIDFNRFAFVGHDFGAMYGVVMGSVDPRPSCYALIAGTPEFPDWYLYYPKLEGKDRQVFIAAMKRIDPVNHVAELSPAPVLFQFARHDHHVPKEKATAFYEAAVEPKQIMWYDADHGLNEKATKDRIQWLVEQLQLSNG
jgi:dienelactone hydrolase